MSFFWSLGRTSSFSLSLLSSSIKNHRSIYNTTVVQNFQQNHCQEQFVEIVAIRLSTKRKLLRISGIDSFIYLQSLLTNDMRRLKPMMITNQSFNNNTHTETKSDHQQRISHIFDQPAIYSYLLSSVGKVLADLFVYRGRYRTEEGEYILEVCLYIAGVAKLLDSLI